MASVTPLKPRAAPPSPMASSWPIAGDVPDIEQIIEEQAGTIAAQAQLIDDYQAVLNAAQNPTPNPPSTGSGTAVNTTSLALVGTSGSPIQNGSSISGAGVPTSPAPIILGQISGTIGGDGTYLVDTLLNINAITLSIAPPQPPWHWPIPVDAPTLLVIQQTQTGILRMQSSLIQQYVDLLNVTDTIPPPTGP